MLWASFGLISKTRYANKLVLTKLQYVLVIFLRTWINTNKIFLFFFHLTEGKLVGSIGWDGSQPDSVFGTGRLATDAETGQMYKVIPLDYTYSNFV